MADEGKKISFGFSKSVKKPVLKNTPAPEVKKVDYIDCLDEKSIKVIGVEEKKTDNVLVIPLMVEKTWHDRIINKVDADIYEPKANKSTKTIKQEQPVTSSSQNGNGPAGTSEPMDITQIKAEPEEEKAPLSLEEMAAQELIQDSKNEVVQEIKKEFVLPMKEQNDLAGVAEPTLDAYDGVPVEQFGMAVLRGMGLKSDTLGKNSNAPHLKDPEIHLRPRGMGLGADKAIKATIKSNKTKEEEKLKIAVGGYVKILDGRYKHNYGKVEGFDYDLSRVDVNLALTGNSESLPEGFVEPVTKTEYDKNSKVLNASKYEEYKSKSSQKETNEKPEKLSSSDLSRKSRRYDSEEESSESEKRRTRRRKSSSESEDDYREKKSKKKSKHRERESSKHESRKSKKKDKDRERTRDRRDHSESPERRKSSKKHKRSRS